MCELAQPGCRSMDGENLYPALLPARATQGAARRENTSPVGNLCRVLGLLEAGERWSTRTEV